MTDEKHAVFPSSLLPFAFCLLPFAFQTAASERTGSRRTAAAAAAATRAASGGVACRVGTCRSDSPARGGIREGAASLARGWATSGRPSTPAAPRAAVAAGGQLG